MTITELLSMNLQRFNGDDGDGGEGEVNPNGETNPDNDGGEASPTFTQSELDAHTNKAVQKALDNVKKSTYTKEQLQAEINKAINKQKEYSDLSDEERGQRELEDEREAFEKEKAEFAYGKLVADVKVDLAEKGLPIMFADYLAVEGDNEKSLERVVEFEKEWNKAIAADREKNIASNSHIPGGGSNPPANKNKVGTIGKNIAEKRKKQQSKKQNTYFN